MAKKKAASKNKLANLRRRVEKEIKNHKKWCGRSCKPAANGGTFLPDEYRRMRLVQGLSAKEVQDDYDTCHIFR